MGIAFSFCFPAYANLSYTHSLVQVGVDPSPPAAITLASSAHVPAFAELGDYERFLATPAKSPGGQLSLGSLPGRASVEHRTAVSVKILDFTSALRL
jgi:hypothetical protein